MAGGRLARGGVGGADLLAGGAGGNAGRTGDRTFNAANPSSTFLPLAAVLAVPLSPSGSGGSGSGSGSGRICKRRQKLDTTRRKTARIAKLEQEMAERLRLVESLEAEKEELQRKERLLKLQVRRKRQGNKAE